MNTTNSTTSDKTDQKSRRVIVVDTDPGVRWSLKKGLSRSGYVVEEASNLAQALRLLHEKPTDAIVMELLPEAGLDFDALTTLVETSGPHKVVCTSVDTAPQVVIECVRRGAADYLMKPFSLDEARRAVAKAAEARPIVQPSAVGEPQAPLGDAASLIGVSPAMQELRQLIARAAQTDLNCLVRGESGVGKDLVAREIHRLSNRNDKPFVKINCSALPEHLLESELFGYEKGAFTGAYKSKPGRFSLADPGIIFLDEIGDMYVGLQAKILQVIEHKEFTKVGGRKPVHVDVQVVAATNANLEDKIARKDFRDDLYFRLNEVYIWVPPLRERREDVPLLVHHFVQKHSEFSSAESAGITGGDLEALSQHDWPGNIRELESTVKRWLALGRKGLISEHLERAMRQFSAGSTSSFAKAGSVSAPRPASSADEDDLDSETILDALERNQWNRRKASEDLGISYSALRRRIEKHELDKRVER